MWLLGQDAVTSAGPLLALLGFAVLPFVWSVPEALVTAELATAFPEDSGCAGTAHSACMCSLLTLGHVVTVCDVPSSSNNT